MKRHSQSSNKSLQAYHYKALLEQAQAPSQAKLNKWRTSERGLLSRRSMNQYHLTSSANVQEALSQSQYYSEGKQMNRLKGPQISSQDVGVFYSRLEEGESIELEEDPLSHSQALQKYATLYKQEETGSSTKAKSTFRMHKNSRTSSVTLGRKDSVPSGKATSSNQLSNYSPRVQRTLLYQFSGQNRRMPKSPSSSSLNANLAHIKKLRDSNKSFETFSTKKGESYSTVELVKTILRSNRKSQTSLIESQNSKMMSPNSQAFHAASHKGLSFSTEAQFDLHKELVQRVVHRPKKSDSMLSLPDRIRQSNRNSQKLFPPAQSVNLANITQERDQMQKSNRTPQMKKAAMRQRKTSQFEPAQKIDLQEILSLHKKTVEDINYLQSLRFEVDLNFHKNFSRHEGLSYLCQDTEGDHQEDVSQSGASKLDLVHTSITNLTTEGQDEIAKQIDISALTALTTQNVFGKSSSVTLHNLPHEFTVLYEEMISFLKNNLQQDREVLQAHQEDLSKHFKEATRKMRKIIKSVMSSLSPQYIQESKRVTQESVNVADFGYSLSLMLDLFWKNTVCKIDRFCASFQELIRQKQQYAYYELERARERHKKEIEEVKKQFQILQRQNEQKIEKLELKLQKTRNDKLKIQEMYQSSNRIIQELHQRQYGQKVVKDLSSAINDLTEFIESAEEHKEQQLTQLQEMNNIIIDYEQNYRRNDKQCQTDLSATQYTHPSLGDVANFHFSQSLHPFGAAAVRYVESEGKAMKAGMYNMRQLIHLCEKVFQQKKEKTQDDFKAGRKPRTLREYVVSSVYAENELSTQMVGDLILTQILNTISYLQKKNHPYGQLLGKLLWINSESPLEDSYVEQFLEVRYKFNRYFKKGKGKGKELESPNDEFGSIRLFDFISFLKNEFKSKSQIYFGNLLLSYVTTQNFKLDFTVNNEEKYVVARDKIIKRLEQSGLIDQYESSLVHRLNFAIYTLAIQLQDFSLTLQERLKQYDYQSDTLITELDFIELIQRMREFPVWIPRDHEELFKLFLFKRKGYQEVTRLNFPLRKQKNSYSISIDKSPPVRQDSVSSIALTASPKTRKSSSPAPFISPIAIKGVEVEEERKDSIQLKELETLPEFEEQDFSDPNEIFIDVQFLLDILDVQDVFAHSHSVQVNNLGVQIGIVRAIQECDRYSATKIDDYLLKIAEITDLKNDFTAFRRALKHFIPHVEIGFATQVFSEWMKQPDRNDILSLRRVLLQIAKHQDYKSGKCLLLSQLSLSRPATPRGPSRSRTMGFKGSMQGLPRILSEASKVERSFSEMNL